MAADSRNNNSYQLKADDKLFGRRGFVIFQRVYDILPEESQKKFELRTKLGKLKYEGSPSITMAYNPADEAVAATIGDWEEDELELNEDEDDDE